MTVSNQTPVVSYTATGLTPDFAFPWTILDEDDLVVKIDGATPSIAYTVSGIGESSGTVSFTSNPSKGSVVKLQRYVTPGRTTDYQTNGDLFARVLNDDVDRLWMAAIGYAYLFGNNDPAAARALLLGSDDAVGSGAYLANANRIANLAYPKSDTDASTYGAARDIGEKLVAGVTGGYGYFQQNGGGAVGRTFQSKMREHVTPEDFGIANDFDIDAMEGTDYTEQVLEMVNVAATYGYPILLPYGMKIMTDTIALYKGARNPDFPAKPGRLRFYGGSGGLATGAFEAQGAAFVHKNGSAAPLIETIGTFSTADVSNMGGQIILERVNLWGGDQTTDVLYTEASNGQQLLENLFVRIANPAGNGITEKTTWEGKLSNVTVYGRASGDGSWTGIGLNICSNDSGGQINMKVYENVNVYKCGYGIRVGRRAVTSGTFGPLVFTGGQVSTSDQHGMWLDGGAYNLMSIGQQFEGSRLNGLYIDSGGANDLPRNNKFIGSYFTTNGKIADGSNNQYDVQVVDGVQTELDHPLFNNSNGALIYDATNALNLLVRRPEIRTTSTFGKASGIGFSYFNSYNPAARIRIEDPVFEQNYAININDPNNAIAAGRPEVKRISLATASTTPSVSLGGNTGGDTANQLNLNNQAATTVTNILNGRAFQRLLLTFSNLLTTIQYNSNIQLASGRDFTPSSSSDTLELYYTGSKWLEINRSRFIPYASSWSDTSILKLGAYNFWVDSSGRLRIKSGTPTSDTDGTIVGAQS